MKITSHYKRLMIWAAGAMLAFGCTSDQQEQEDIVYSDQPQQQEQQQQEDYAEAEDSTGGESAVDDAESSEGEDLVSSYQEELSSDDAPASEGIADSAAEASAGGDTKWNSSTNDYSSGETYAGNDGSSTADSASQPTDPSLNYTTEPAYDNSADAGSTNTARKSWKKKSSAKWAKSSSSSQNAGYQGAGYNDNLSTDLTGNQRLYIVQRGDTLSSIAHKIYGDAALWNELAATNSISNANTIFPGDPIKFVSNAYSKDFEATYDNIAKNTITVQSGDTLSSIAQQVFGDSGEWKVLFTMNKSEIADPNTISPNQVLYYFTRQSFNQAFMQSNIKERFGH